jgi:cell division protein ZapA
MTELAISVKISERSYRLKIHSEEEEVVRKAAENINKAIRDYSVNYAYSDKQDLLAMAAIQFATSSYRLERNHHFSERFLVDRLTVLDDMLTESLKKT